MLDIFGIILAIAVTIGVIVFLILGIVFMIYAIKEIRGDVREEVGKKTRFLS